MADSETARPRFQKFRHVARRHFVLFLVVVVAGGAFFSWRSYQKNVTNGQKTLNGEGFDVGNQEFVQTKDNPAFSGIGINADLRSVTPETESAQVRLSFDHFGTYENEDGFLSKKVTVIVLGAITDPNSQDNKSANVYEFDVGQEMRTLDLAINLTNSNGPKYPFDTYSGRLLFKVIDSDGKPIASEMGLLNKADGWSVDKRDCNDQDRCTQPSGTFGLDLNVGRRNDSKLFTVFIVGIMWALTVAAVLMAQGLIRKKEQIEHDPLIYLAALLFAFPLIRTLLPGDPPLGVLADFAGYFWIEAITGFSLLALLITRIWREHHEFAEQPGTPRAADSGDVLL